MDLTSTSMQGLSYVIWGKCPNIFRPPPPAALSSGIDSAIRTVVMTE